MKKNKLVLLDFSNIMYSTFFSLMGSNVDNEKFFSESINLWKHLILNSIISYSRKFKVDTKNMVLCFDEKYVWRNDIFKYYKKNRKKGRDNSGIDFKKFFEEMDIFKKELNENFPLMSLQCTKAEADDIIYILCKKLSSKYELIVGSMDKDLRAVLRFDNVKFFNIKRQGGKWINIDKREIPAMMQRHIIMGDVSDGIPNIFSDEDTYMNDSKKSKRLGDKKITEIIENGLDNYITTKKQRERYEQNTRLIDMEFIPDEIIKNIEKEFIKEFKKDKKWDKAIKWLEHNKFRNILKDLDKDFINDSFEYAEKSMSKWSDKIKEKNSNNHSLF